MYTKQEINIPADCLLIKHDFYNYDPKTNFKDEDSLKFLNEDLFQCKFPLENLTIDLGWYGDIDSNKGEFKIYIIEGENWEVPLNTIHPKSTEEAKVLLNKIIEYYTGVNK